MGTSVIVPPDPPNKPYDTVGYTLQLARVIVNDAAGPNGVEGDLLSASQPYTVVLLNSAFRKLQDELINAGVESLVKEVLIANLPPVAQSDPSVFTFLTWDQYWDGAASHTDINAPSDMILPSELWERHGGSGESFTPVKPWDGGLPEGMQGNKLRWYEWRDDKIFFKGATSAVDLKLRYVAYYPELDVEDDTEIPIMRASRAVAYLMAAEWARSKGSPSADMLDERGEEEVKVITARTSRRKAAISYRRRSYGA